MRLVAGEPGHRAPQHLVVGEGLGHLGFDGTQILPHHDGVGAVRLQGEYGKHGLGVVVHVGAAVGGVARRDPPQPPQTGHVVDTQSVGMVQDSTQHVAQRGVSGGGQPVRSPGRQTPVLPARGEVVRRCSHAHPRGQNLGQRPGVGAVGVHPHRKIMQHTHSHAGVMGMAPQTRQLVGALLLNPGVKRHPGSQLSPSGGHRRAADVTQF